MPSAAWSIVEIAASSYEGIPLLRVSGELDVVSAPALQRTINSCLDDRAPGLLLDLTECPFIDSGGLSVFLTTVRDLTPERWLGVVGASPNLLRVFTIVGLDSDPRFRVFDDLSEVPLSTLAPDAGTA
jgi:anti-anti-sigma factor